MDAHILTLLCDPETHEALEFQPDALVNVRSGKRYPIRDGIPDFLDTVSGQNKKYQELYDRIAVFYDLSEKLYCWLKRKQDFRSVSQALTGPAQGKFPETTQQTIAASSEES